MKVEFSRKDMPVGKQKTPFDEVTWKTFLCSVIKAVWYRSERVVFVDDDGTMKLLKGV